MNVIRISLGLLLCGLVLSATAWADDQAKSKEAKPTLAAEIKAALNDRAKLSRLLASKIRSISTTMAQDPDAAAKKIAELEAALKGLEPGSAAVILDPPRAGCHRSVLKALRDPGIGRIVYVSCNPATFARDADRLTQMHWRLKRVVPVDLFPQTSHVELSALFTR